MGHLSPPARENQTWVDYTVTQVYFFFVPKSILSERPPANTETREQCRQYSVQDICTETPTAIVKTQVTHVHIDTGSHTRHQEGKNIPSSVPWQVSVCPARLSCIR